MTLIQKVAQRHLIKTASLDSWVRKIKQSLSKLPPAILNKLKYLAQKYQDLDQFVSKVTDLAYTYVKGIPKRISDALVKALDKSGVTKLLAMIGDGVVAVGDWVLDRWDEVKDFFGWKFASEEKLPVKWQGSLIYFTVLMSLAYLLTHPMLQPIRKMLLINLFFGG